MVELFKDLQFMISCSIYGALDASSQLFGSCRTSRSTGSWGISNKALLCALKGNRSGFSFELSKCQTTLGSLLNCFRNRFLYAICK